MRLLIVLIALVQLKQYETTHNSGPFSPQNVFRGFPQNQYGPVQQSPFQIPSFNDGIPQQTLIGPNNQFLPPPQGNQRIQLPQDVEGYQLVHSGFPSGPESKQGSTQLPPTIQGNPSFLGQLQNGYQNTAPAPVTNNGIYRLPRGNFPFPRQNPLNNPFRVSPLGEGRFNSLQNPLQIFQQNIPQQPFFQPSAPGLQVVQGSQGPQSIQGLQDEDCDDDAKNTQSPAAPTFQVNQNPSQNKPYSPFPFNPISEDILPYITMQNNPARNAHLSTSSIFSNSPQQNLPQINKILSNIPNLPQQNDLPLNGQISSNPFFPNPYFPNPFQSNPFIPNRLSPLDLTNNLEVASVPGQQTNQNDGLLQLLRNHQPQVNKQGHQIINEFLKNQRAGNPQINEEGYQVVNEGPVTHYISVGEPKTKIVTLDIQRPNSFTKGFYYSSNSRNNNDQLLDRNIIPTITQKQPTIIANTTQQNVQADEDCDNDSQPKEPQKHQIPVTDVAEEDCDNDQSGNNRPSLGNINRKRDV